MHVLVLGSGGREHAICWALHQSPKLSSLHVAPGNPGMASIAQCASVDPSDHDAILAYCKQHDIALVIPGPEAPIVEGIADFLYQHHIHVFAPSKEGAQLEASKSFMKQLCDEHHIPTASFATFEDADSAKSYLAKVGVPVVIKADGLAAGKGVTIAETETEALQTIDAMFDGAFGHASKKIIMEEFLEGPEISFFALCDGKRAIPFASAQDYKRVGDGGKGPNTGGMGAISPTPLLTDDVQDVIMKTIINPTFSALQEKGIHFKGVFFAGLMMTKDGPKLLEYNIRFGDPETEAFLPRLKSDLLEIILACCEGRGDTISIEWHPGYTCCVVMAAKGYPAAYRKGSEIRNLEALTSMPNIIPLHAGTKQVDGQLQAHGGRVLDIVAQGDTIPQARERAYQAVELIDWEDGFCRYDIGKEF